MARRLETIIAGERFDVLEEEMPRETCSVDGCDRSAAIYAIAGQWRIFWVCSRHRPLYRTHQRILERIRSL